MQADLADSLRAPSLASHRNPLQVLHTNMSVPYRVRQFLATASLYLLATSTAHSQVYINEIYFDPPGGGDNFNEYIELRGTPSLSLQDHYLIFLENEISDTANPGTVDNIFDFGSITGDVTLGTNGYLTIRQGFNAYTTIAPGTTNLVNTGSTFTFGSGPSSTVGHTDEGEGGVIENSGFTAMLVRVDSGAGGLAPTIGQDLDADDDNELDVATGAANWTILDSVGINSEADDINGMLYAPVNFSAGTPDGGINVPAGAEAFDMGAEIEYIGRWGNSTGSTLADWHASNLSNDGGTGFDGPDDFRQAAEPHGIGTPNQFVETSQGLPYGAVVTGTLGAPNRFSLDGDFTYDVASDSFDGDVDGNDFLHWQQNFGFGVGLGVTQGATATREHGDANRDRVVNGDDLAVWQTNYGQTVAPATAALASQTIPEPGTLGLLLFGVVVGLQGVRLPLSR